MTAAEAQSPLAHSAPALGRDPQPYADHATAVRSGARDRAEAMLRFATSPPAGLADAVEAAGAFHDLGKLDPETQAALHRGRRAKLRWDHIDAGVAHLWACKAGMSAWLVRAHHAPGLPSNSKHFGDALGPKLRGRRNDGDHQDRHEEQVERTRGHLAELLATHLTVVGPTTVQRSKVSHGLAMRLALSCLVDADYSDTAQSDAGLPPPEPAQPRWAERLAQLDAYVAGLPPSGNAERDRHRREFYEACRNSCLDEPLVTCEGPVGIGKTTAVTAYLLARAKATGLRRIVVVAPYTNIISQTASTLRRALVLRDETPDAVVAEHHHRADFSSRDARELAVTWNAPVIVTTAVQLFETLASNEPASLRKLHALPGSAIFLDEAHAALPAHLWPQNWLWLSKLARRWGCRVVLASGSLVRFWENKDVVRKSERLQDLLEEGLRRFVLAAEGRRITYMSCDRRFETVSALAETVAAQPGPRLVILNTVQSAAVVARAMRQADHDVLHLSTALAPNDRGPLLQLVTEKLNASRTDWTLVATSCVEAGVDLSFRTAFRERFSATSLIQTGGRVNRHGEGRAGTVFDFVIDATSGITAHPAARDPARVLGRLLRHGAFEAQHDPAEVVSGAMADEIRERGGLGDNELCRREEERDYPCVAKLGRVIDADTRIVVVDPVLAERISRWERVSFRDLLSGSVQLWAHKVETLRLQPLRDGVDAYRWPYEYDPAFLGIMEGVLRLSDLNGEGFTIL